jgi:hypothetical protein
MSDVSTLSCTELQSQLDSVSRNFSEVNAEVVQIKQKLTADEWFHAGTDKAEVLDDICRILGVNPTVSVSITATISISVTAEVPISELDDFDADGHLSDWLSVDMSNGDSSVDDWSVDIADYEAQ